MCSGVVCETLRRDVHNSWWEFQIIFMIQLKDFILFQRIWLRVQLSNKITHWYSRVFHFAYIKAGGRGERTTYCDDCGRPAITRVIITPKVFPLCSLRSYSIPPNCAILDVVNLVNDEQWPLKLLGPSVKHSCKLLYLHGIKKVDRGALLTLHTDSYRKVD